MLSMGWARVGAGGSFGGLAPHPLRYITELCGRLVEEREISKTLQNLYANLVKLPSTKQCDKQRRPSTLKAFMEKTYCIMCA